MHDPVSRGGDVAELFRTRAIGCGQTVHAIAAIGTLVDVRGPGRVDVARRVFK